MVKGPKAYEAWGLTGGIAAGKSQAARLFAEAGFPVLDADLLARELASPGGAAHDAIVARFGTADRGRLRKLVFGDPAARRELEAILHPRIVAESRRRMAKLAEAHPGPGPAHVLYEAALLVETERYHELDGLIVIDAPAALRRERLIRRDGVSPELADQILAAQATDEQRAAAATALIPNTGTLEDLRHAVRGFVERAGWRA